MTENDRRSKSKRRHRSADSRHRHRLSEKRKLDVVDSPIEEKSHVTNVSCKTSTDRRNVQEAVDARELPAESPSRRESAHKKRRTDHDSTGESKTGYSPALSNSRTSEHLCDFRTQQLSSGSNQEELRSKHDDTQSSASMLEQIQHHKRWKNALESLETTQDSAQQSKKKNGDTKLDRNTEALPSNAAANVDERPGRDVPECSLSNGKSSNDIEKIDGLEKSTDHKMKDLHSKGKTTSSIDEVISMQETSTSDKQKGTISDKGIMEVEGSDEANWTHSSLTTGSLNTPVQTSSCKSSDNTFCNKLNLSRGSIVSRSETCPEVEADDVNKNVATAISNEHTSTSHVDPKSLAKQCIDQRTNTQSTSEINKVCYKMGIKRKLILSEDNTSLEKIQKKTQAESLASVNMTIGDIQVSNNNQKSIYDESTEDERVTEHNVKERQMFRGRNKRYVKRKRDMRVLNTNKLKMAKAAKAVKNIRKIFRRLFGENTTKSESENEHIILKARYDVQEKSIDSCTTVTDSSGDDNISVCKSDIHTDDTQRDVKDKSLVKVENKMKLPVTINTENISKNGIFVEFPVAKIDTQKVTNVAEADTKEYISKEEIQKLLRILRQNMTKTVQNIFKRIEQSNRWSSEVKQILREILDENNESFSTNRDSNLNMNLLNILSTKLISDVEGKKNNGSCDTVNLTLMKNDIFTENTNTMRIDCKSTPEKKNVCGDETHAVSKDSCLNSVSTNESINIDDNSFLLSNDDTSKASTVIINHSLTPPEKSVCEDEVHTVNKNSCVDMSANQFSINISNNNSLTDDTFGVDDEIEVKIEIKSKSESASETLSLKIPASMKSKYFDNLKNNLCRIISTISLEMTTSANTNRTGQNDASVEALNANQVVITKNIETISSIQQVSCDSNHATQISINRSLQKENSQDDLRSHNDRQNTTMKSNEVGNDQCVQSVERKNMQTEPTLVPILTADSARPTLFRSFKKKKTSKNFSNKSKKDNKQIKQTKCIQFGLDSPTSINLTTSGTSATTNSVTTVASSQVSQASLSTNTSSITTVSASHSVVTCASAGNLYDQYNSIVISEETILLDNIGRIIQFCRSFMDNNSSNLLQNSNTATAVMMLYNHIEKLTVLLWKNNMYYRQSVDYAIYRLNSGMLQNCPTSVEEIEKLTSFIKKNHPLLIANRTAPSISTQKSSQSVQSNSIADREIPHTVRSQTTKNTTLHIGCPNQATKSAVNEQRLEDNTNKTASTVNASQHRFPNNMGHILQTPQQDFTTMNTSFPQSTDANISYMPLTDSSSVNIYWQQSSGSHMQQPGAAIGNIERQQSLDSTNNIPLMPWSSPGTVNIRRQQLLDGYWNYWTNNIPFRPQISIPVTANVERYSSVNTNNIPCTQQSSSATENIEQQQSSGNLNISHVPQSSPATINIGQRQSSNNVNNNNILRMPLVPTANMKRQCSTGTSNIPCMQQPSATENIEQQQSSANVKNIHQVTNSVLSNTAHASKVVPLSGSTMTSIDQQQFPKNIPYTTSYVLNPGREAMEHYQQFGRFIGPQPLGNVYNAPYVPHSTIPILNINQMSQCTNVAKHSTHKRLKNVSNAKSQQRFYFPYTEYPNCMLPPGIKDITPATVPRNVSSLPTNTITSDSIRQEQGRGTSIASEKINSRATTFIPNAQQLQQASLQQQSNGSVVPNTLPNYKNMVPIAGNASETVIHQSRPPPPPYVMPAYHISNYHQQSEIVSNLLHANTMYQHMNVNHQPHVIIQDTTAKCLNNTPVESITVQQNAVDEISQKTRSLQQDVVANTAATGGRPAVSSNPSTNANMQQSVIPNNAKKQKQECTPKSKMAMASGTSSHSELACQRVPKSSISSGKNIPQNSAIDAGTPATSSELDASNTSNFRISVPVSNISRDMPSLSDNSPSSKSQNTTQSISTKNAQGPLQSAAQITYVFNLDIFTDIQKLIIQDHLKTYLKISLKETWHVLTKQQLKMWEAERNLLRCFHNSLWKYLNKFEEKNAEITQVDETQSFSLCRKQKESVGQRETTKLRCNEKLEKMICLRDDANSNISTAKSTSKDSPQDEEPLKTSNSPKLATTILSKLLEQQNTCKYKNTLYSKLESLIEDFILWEYSDTSHTDSTMKNTAESNGTAKSTESQLQGSSTEQPSEQSFPVLVTDAQNLIDKCKEKSSSDAQQEQNDNILFVEKHKSNTCAVDVIQHELKKPENLSKDVIDVSPINLCQSLPNAKVQDLETVSEQLTSKREFVKVENLSKDIKDISPIDLCQSLPNAKVQDLEIVNEQLISKHEFVKVENLSKDNIDISPIKLCQSSSDAKVQDLEIANQQLTSKHEFVKVENLSKDNIDISPIELCQSSSDAKVQDLEIANQQLTSKREFVKVENLSKDNIDISPIELCQSSSNAKVQDLEIANEQLMPKKKKTQIEEVFRDFEAPEQARNSIEENDRSKAQSTQWGDEKEITILSSNRNELETSKKQLGYSSELEHNEKPQTLLVKKEEIDLDIYEDVIIEGDILTENVGTYNPTATKDLESANTLNIFDICSISPTLYEKIDSDTFLVQDDPLQLLDEKENKELSNFNNNLKIVDKDNIPCLRCKRTSTVCCENCLAAYYCSERCSKLHWYSNHHKHCKSYYFT